MLCICFNPLHSRRSFYTMHSFDSPFLPITRPVGTLITIALLLSSLLIPQLLNNLLCSGFFIVYLVHRRIFDSLDLDPSLPLSLIFVAVNH